MLSQAASPCREPRSSTSISKLYWEHKELDSEKKETARIVGWQRVESALLHVCLKSRTSDETKLHSTFRRFLGADPRTRGGRTQTLPLVSLNKCPNNPGLRQSPKSFQKSWSDTAAQLWETPKLGFYLTL